MRLLANPLSKNVFSVYYNFWGVTPILLAIAFWPSIMRTSVFVRYSNKLSTYYLESKLKTLCFFLAYWVSLLYSGLMTSWVASTICEYVLKWRVSTVPGRYSSWTADFAS